MLDLKSTRDWLLISLLTNGVLFAIVLGYWRPWSNWQPLTLTRYEHTPPQALATRPTEPKPQRPKLTYEQWVDLLAREAEVIATDKPDALMILLGDSLSLWFERQNVPLDWAWLNQGISGEKTLGLLRRVDALADTQPKAVFVMIGINDLLWDVSDQTVLANYRLIVEQLQRQHPQADIIVQSVLPHGDDRATWESKSRLRQVPNGRIRRINRHLAELADRQSQVYYLDLHTLFTDDRGNLDMALSTDGLHLNEQGYQVWATALRLFVQLELQS